MNSSEDLATHPLTWEEEVFVTFLVLNLVTDFNAFREGLQADVKQWFDRPVVLHVWHRLGPLQDRAFVEYFARCLNGAGKADE